MLSPEEIATIVETADGTASWKSASDLWKRNAHILDELREALVRNYNSGSATQRGQSSYAFDLAVSQWNMSVTTVIDKMVRSSDVMHDVAYIGDVIKRNVVPSSDITANREAYAASVERAKTDPTAAESVTRLQRDYTKMQSRNTFQYGNFARDMLTINNRLTIDTVPEAAAEEGNAASYGTGDYVTGDIDTSSGRSGMIGLSAYERRRAHQIHQSGTLDDTVFLDLGPELGAVVLPLFPQVPRPVYGAPGHYTPRRGTYHARPSEEEGGISGVGDISTDNAALLLGEAALMNAAYGASASAGLGEAALLGEASAIAASERAATQAALTNAISKLPGTVSRLSGPMGAVGDPNRAFNGIGKLRPGAVARPGRMGMPLAGGQRSDSEDEKQSRKAVITRTDTETVGSVFELSNEGSR